MEAGYPMEAKKAHRQYFGRCASKGKPSGDIILLLRKLGFAPRQELGRIFATLRRVSVRLLDDCQH